MATYTFATSLTERQRKTFAQRLLTLAAVLEAIKPYQYDHDSWLVKYDPEDPWESWGCALAHAAVHPDLFPGLGLDPKQRLLDGSLRWVLVPVNRDLREGPFFGYKPEAEAYFGWSTYDQIFMNFERLNKSQAVRCIRKFARERYGYEPA